MTTLFSSRVKLPPGLRQASTVISSLVKESKLKVVAGYCDVSNGRVTLLE